MVSHPARVPSSGRARRSIAILVLVAVAALPFCWKLFHRENAGTSANTSRKEVARRLERVGDVAVALAELPRQLVSSDAEQRRRADTRVRELLLDRAIAHKYCMKGKDQNRTPADWYREEGASRIEAALFERFDQRLDDAIAVELWTELRRSFPPLSLVIDRDAWLIRGLGCELAPPTEIARVLAESRPRAGLYLLLLEKSRARPSILVGHALLALARGTSNALTRTRCIQLLRRFADPELQQIARSAASSAIVSSLADDELLADRTAGVHSFANLAEWANCVPIRPITALSQSAQLLSDRLELQLAGLERFRFEPIPELDAAVMALASASAAPEIAAASIAAHRSVATSGAVDALRAACDVPALAKVARGALIEWSCWSSGEASDDVLCARIREVALDASARARLAETAPPFASLTLVPILNSRGVLDTDWFQGGGATALLRSTQRGMASERAAAWRGLVGYLRAPLPAELMSLVMTETELEVRASLIDTILVVGGVEAAAQIAMDMVAFVAKSREFPHLDVIEAFDIAFPASKLLAALIESCDATDEGQRGAAAGLFGGLRPSTPQITAMIRLRADPSEWVRYHARAALDRQLQLHADRLNALKPQIVRLVQDAAPGVRAASAELCGELVFDADLLAALARLAADSIPAVKESASKAIAAGMRGQLVAIEELLRGSNALGGAMDETFAEILLEFTHNSDPALREAAARLIGSLSLTRERSARLIELLGDTSPRTRGAAHLSLERLYKQSISFDAEAPTNSAHARKAVAAWQKLLREESGVNVQQH
ncbi:MAG: hypothetical protein ACKVX7_11015 [Planctomycetota bacterium]